MSPLVAGFGLLGDILLIGLVGKITYFAYHYYVGKRQFDASERARESNAKLMARLEEEAEHRELWEKEVKRQKRAAWKKEYAPKVAEWLREQEDSEDNP